MGALPKIVVKNSKTTSSLNRPGMASKVAMVGAFEELFTTPVSVKGLDEAKEKLGTDKTYNGVASAYQLFGKYSGVSSILAINITTKSGSGDQETIDKTLTTQKLTEALAKIKGEDFDMLFIAEEISDEAHAIITEFLEESYEIKRPNGLIAPINRSTKAQFQATCELAHDIIYHYQAQALKVDGVQLSLVESSAFMCGYIASLNVAQSLTNHIIPGVEAISPEYSFEDGDLGKDLVTMGVPVMKCVNRENKEFVVVNSELPNGLDIYINRTRDFVIKQFNLETFLGSWNTDNTITAIKGELNRVKSYCVNTLNLLLDINYEIGKVSSTCVEVHINKLVFAGIITEIDVIVEIEVQ